MGCQGMLWFVGFGVDVATVLVWSLFTALRVYDS